MSRVTYLPFHIDHLQCVYDQKSNRNVKAWVEAGYGLPEEGETMFIDGQMMVSAGVVEAWPKRGVMWSVINEDARHHYVTVLREMRKWLDRQPFDRIEISVEENLPKALRRALLLGFEIQCEKARKYLPNGATCTLLAKIKD